MPSPELLIELGAVLMALALLARVAGRLRIPTIPLYLLAGLAFGKAGSFHWSRRPPSSRSAPRSA